MRRTWPPSSWVGGPSGSATRGSSISWEWRTIHEARVIEIPPGKTIPPQRIALEELVYVVRGRGLCTVWGAEDKEKKTFEWSDRSFFMIPPNYPYQLTNVHGSQPARLMHTNFLPLALSAIPNIDYFVDNPKVDFNILYDADANPFSEAKAIKRAPGSNRVDQLFVGNFFPDMAAWDKLVPIRPARGGHYAALSITDRQGRAHVGLPAPARQARPSPPPRPCDRDPRGRGLHDCLAPERREGDHSLAESPTDGLILGLCAAKRIGRRLVLSSRLCLGIILGITHTEAT